MTLLFVGTFLLLVLFVVSGMNKIANFDGTVKMLHSKLLFKSFPFKSFPFKSFSKLIAQLSIFGVILLFTFGSLFLLYATFMEDKEININKKIRENNNNRNIFIFVVSMFILFMVLATALFHNPIVDPSQKIHFLKNLAITGGFVLLLNNAL